MENNSLDVVNVGYVDEMYQRWKENPEEVPREWQLFFKGFDAALGQISEPDSSGNGHTALITDRERGKMDEWAVGMPRTGSDSAAPVVGKTAQGVADKQQQVNRLLDAYRSLGYVYANLNPLDRYETPEMRYMRITVEGNYSSLSLQEYSLSDDDLDTEFENGTYFQPRSAPLREILRQAKEIYTGTLGVDILHILNKPMKRWLLEKIESPGSRRTWSREQKIRIQKDLIKAEEFESFLQTNFVGQKRFSLEGGESLIPAMHYLIYTAAQHNLKEIVLGMAHRGRLNIFTNALRKPGVETFSKFIDNYKPHTYGGTGDVKYHLGHSFDFHDKETGKVIHISLVANPSHLEAVDPVVEGKARGIQRLRNDYNRKKVMPVLIHGDAAFSGQGVVAETLNLSLLKGYRTGGTIHIILNNQIGFTTASRDARSTFFATDIAKSMPIPIFHCNGDDPESVVRAIDLAMRWRQKFGYDVVVDIFCYRRLGHNEADEPSFTHPIMYDLIRKHPSVTSIYGKKLQESGDYPEEEQEAFRRQYRQVLKEELEEAKHGYTPNLDDAFEKGEWTGFQREYSFEPVETGVERSTLEAVGKAIVTVPEGFNLHPKLKRLVKARSEMIESGEGLDWGMAEALAFGTLLKEGYPIRLSGEDCARGTFSHRHAEWWDVEAKTPRTYTPLQHVGEGQGTFSVYDSPLSEFSVLGFDYGYSLAQPNILVIWEAQFGDFVNGAQVVIDQFISSSERKWFRSSGLVMLLPHGYEGQGAEHSSAHLERFLQLCAENNMQVVNPTTPAQAFHMFRRQMKQNFRKPLIVMSPKSLLRHKEAVSPLRELESGHFRYVIDDPNTDAKNLIFCSGKVFYDLAAKRAELEDESTAIIRIEQLYPFPQEELKKIASRYKKRERLIWAQEESRNRGAWRFIQNRLATILDVENIEYVGRGPSASPATGSYNEHQEQLESLLNDAFAHRGKVAKR
ncbi:MAG: 2-oxoglutarate dehydrogenase E1 component [Alkalispirochaetaceae bacterium]